MHKDYQYKLALSINRNDLMKNFSMALKLAIAKYWNGREVSAAQFANEFNKHCELNEKVNRETVRRWVRGDAFPEPMAFALLHQWLKLDVNLIYETIPLIEKPSGGEELKKKIAKQDLLEILVGIEQYTDQEELFEIILKLKAIYLKRL